MDVLLETSVIRKNTSDETIEISLIISWMSRAIYLIIHSHFTDWGLKYIEKIANDETKNNK